MHANKEFIRTSGEIKEFALDLTELLYPEGKSRYPRKEFKTQEEVEELLDSLDLLRRQMFDEYEHNKNYDPESFYIP